MLTSQANLTEPYSDGRAETPVQTWLLLPAQAVLSWFSTYTQPRIASKAFGAQLVLEMQPERPKPKPLVISCRNILVGSDEKIVFEQWRIPVAVQPLKQARFRCGACIAEQLQNWLTCKDSRGNI